MPRINGKKGSTDEDDFVVEMKQKYKDTDQPDLGIFIEKLQKAYPYWIKRGHKLTCSLCSVNVQFSSVTSFKTEVQTHMKSKRHKKKVEFNILEKDYAEKSGVNHVTSKEDYAKKPEVNNVTNEEDRQKVKVKEKNNNLLDLIEEVHYQLSQGLKLTDKKHTKCNKNKQLVDFDTIYLSLEKDNPVTQASKKYIVKAKDGRNYFCTICQEIIFESLNANVFRHNLWTHINDESHREKLPNFSQVQRSFKKLIKKLSTKIPSNLKNDLKYFEIGPRFRFVRCSLCNVAVSENLHRLENHIADVHHQNRKGEEPKELSPRSNNNRICDWYKNYISNMEPQFQESQLKEDMKYIHIDNMPGYVVCSLCSCIVLPTFYYLKVHFESNQHVNNKTANLINWESAYKTDLMNNLDDNPIDYSQFEESKYGIKCHRCSRTMPPTSYAVYCHMTKTDCEGK